MGKQAATASNELPHLYTFSAAAESGTFTAVARLLAITQSAVSQRIQVLEQSVGQSLFHRRGGRVVLTEAGQRLYPYAQRILALHHEAWKEMTGQAVPVAGELQLGASTVPGEHLLPAVLSDFHHLYPHVRLRVNIGDSMAVLRQVERGHVSVGLVGTKAGGRHLEFRHFATDHAVLVVPPAHTWARRKRVPLKLLRSQPLVLREAGSGLRLFLEELLERAGTPISDMHVAMELGSNEAIKEAVVRGMGVAILSAHAVRREVQLGHLRCLTVAGIESSRELFAVVDRRRALPAPARAFLHFLESHAPRAGSTCP